MVIGGQFVIYGGYIKEVNAVATKGLIGSIDIVGSDYIVNTRTFKAMASNNGKS